MSRAIRGLVQAKASPMAVIATTRRTWLAMIQLPKSRAASPNSCRPFAMMRRASTSSSLCALNQSSIALVASVMRWVNRSMPAVNAGVLVKSTSRCIPFVAMSKKGCMTWPETMSKVSLMVDSRPAKVTLCFSIIPPNLAFIPSTRAEMAVLAEMAPRSDIFMASGTVTPMASASIFQAGIPDSASCIISSAETLPFAIIWPRARVTRSIISPLPPSPATASPTAVRVGSTSSAANPIARRRWAP